MIPPDSAGAVPPSDELWDFSVRLYARPGVAEACLDLQDVSRVNVPVLLLGAWLGRRSIALDPGAIARIGAEAAPWHDQVVFPLRRLRRLLKDAPPPGRSPSADALRQRIKASELEAERIEITHLETLAGKLSLPATAPDALSRNLAGIVSHYRGSELDEQALRAVATIAAATPGV
ncbi:hypothetical protein BH10PSE9_BH10PSE9_00440 [soil metagenome]